MITLSEQIELSSDVVFQELLGEAVLLDLEQDMYFGLDQVATLVWQSLARDPSLRAAYAVVLGKYDVDAVLLEKDVILFVESLLNAGIARLMSTSSVDQDVRNKSVGGDPRAQ